jgi:hypothetical protein
MLQQRSPGSVVAAERLLGDSAVLYDDVDDLVARLHDRAGLDRAARASQEGRLRFTFDAHVDRLVGVLERAAARRG